MQVKNFIAQKMGVENSYNSPDEINKITWNPKAEAVDKLKKLLKNQKKSIYFIVWIV